MTQTVFSNDMVAHVWAQQRQPHGRSNNGNFYFDGAILYSYGTHYPVGIFAKDGAVFLNSSRSSITTEGKHKNAAYSATRHIERRFHLPELDEITDAIRRAADKGAPEHHAQNIRRYLAKHWQSIAADNDGAAWLLNAIGYRGTWAAMRARLAAKADKQARTNAARLKASQIREGREIAARPWPVMLFSAWQGAKDFGQRGLREMISDCRSARLATPKAHKRVRATLWQREQALRAIAAKARADADRYGNPGNRTKARAVLQRLRAFKAGRIGFVPGYDGPDGDAKREAALALESGAGWRALANLISEIAALGVHMPPALRLRAENLFAKADAIATEREGEEKQRQEIRSARSAVLRNLRSFNQGRRHYRQLVASGAWAGGLPDGSRYLDEMTDRQRMRVLDSITGHVVPAVPWGQERGLQLCPPLAARTAAIAARCEAIAAELEPIREALRTEAERAEIARREAERAERERIAAMSDDEKRAAWEAGELSDSVVRHIEQASGPLLRAIAPEIDGCQVTGGTLATSMGAQVPLRHAFRVFQIVAYCRAQRIAWRPDGNSHGLPRQIRVGHFRVDSIAPSGDFVAGCHSIQWAQVSSLAERLGVAGCLATPAEMISEESDAA